MHYLRKIIVRHSWLITVAVFALLVQIQQTLACDMMIDVSAPASEHCYKHEAGNHQSGKSAHPCCDFSAGLSVNTGHCHDGHETVVNYNLSGKLNPDIQPLILTINIQDVFPPAYLTAVYSVPESGLSHPGTRTYLSTQRLRI